MALLAAAAPATAGVRPVPRGWIGVHAGSELLAQPEFIEPEVRVMRRSGVESVRTVLYWSGAQPYRRWADVPDEERGRFHSAGGLPIDTGQIDRLVAAAARRGMAVMPAVLGAPRWATDDTTIIDVPRDPADYGRFLTALVDRFGPRGSFWSEHPELPRRPIREWQAWNEPNLDSYWPLGDGRREWPRSYTALLRASWKSVHAADPGAKVVLAGLANYSWRGLARLYRAGARRWMDIVAVNTYTYRISGVIAVIRRVRAAMRTGRDRGKPIEVTEFGWPSGKGRSHPSYPFLVTPRQAAQRARDALPALARVRVSLGIRRIYWYTWLSSYSIERPFAYAGLHSLETGRPAATNVLGAFARAAHTLEGGRR